MVVEDDDDARAALVASLRSHSFDVHEAASCDDALRVFLGERPDIIITDLYLPDGDAIALLPRIRAHDASVPVYVITGFATIDIAVRAVKEGAEEFFTKPIDLARLIQFARTTVERRKTLKTGKRPKHVLTLTSDGALPDARTTRSPAMQRLEQDLARLRNSDCTVLILGETGTGKTLLARRIHALGARADAPFIDVNCAGLSRDFVESELFGHERGAFTGAHATKQGLLDLANGGTLFLDEIGDIDVQVQPKILKVIEERRFRRMGDVRERNTDVRLLAATHLDLLDAVERKVFRADLFYRISTVMLTMPALRERVEDIVPLVEQILAQEGAGAPTDVSVAPAAWDKLQSYQWPGNIRELKNVIKRALLLRQGDVVAADDVRFDGSSSSSSASSSSRQMPAVQPVLPAAAAVQELAAEAATATTTLEEMERTHIHHALEKENGRVKDAAVRLGIPRSTLYQKIKNYGIRLPRRKPQ